MSFPILWMSKFSWGPVAGANPPKMNGPPGVSYLGPFRAATGCQETLRVHRMGKCVRP
jgi:hypothetical protein